jgi:hypothetical protein
VDPAWWDAEGLVTSARDIAASPAVPIGLEISTFLALPSIKAIESRQRLLMPQADTLAFMPQ